MILILHFDLNAHANDLLPISSTTKSQFESMNIARLLKAVPIKMKV
jgi:hypothetical protein